MHRHIRRENILLKGASKQAINNIHHNYLLNPSSVLWASCYQIELYLLEYPRARTFQSVRWRGFFFLLTPKKWGSYGEVFAYVSDQCPDISLLSDACQNHKGRQLPSHLIIFTSGEWNVWRLPLGCLSQISSFSNNYANKNWFKKLPLLLNSKFLKNSITWLPIIYLLS